MSGPLYHSHLGVIDFQAEGVGEAYVDPNPVAFWDTGIGKTHLAMLLGCVMFEDDLIDQILVVAEKNKVLDWVADFSKFTDLTAMAYAGDKAKREKLRNDPPQVLCGTYETIKNDAAIAGKTKRANWIEGPLTHALKRRRVLVVYDECTRLRGRGTGLYKAHERMVKSLRAAHNGTKVLGLTGTPIETSPEGAFNFGRIIKGEDVMGTVADFEKNHIVSYDLFKNPNKFKNIGERDHVDLDVPTLRDRLAPMVKKKTDPDVYSQFPKQIEEFIVTPMGKTQAELYRAVAGSLSEEERAAMMEELGQKQGALAIAEHERSLFMALRLIAGYPLALTRANGALATKITQEVGEAGLRAMGSPKRDRLIENLDQVVRGQGDRVVVFSFFADTFIPLLADDLRNEGFEVVLNVGSMSGPARQASIEAFRSGRAEVFLSSDAGSKGLNLPEALYVDNFELPPTIANYIQRINRNNRIDSPHPSVTCRSYIAPDTVEEGLRYLMLSRNDYHDTLLEDGEDGRGFISADDRRKLISNAFKMHDIRAAAAA